MDNINSILNQEPKWYILSVWSSKELKVKQNIEKLLETNEGLKNFVFQIEVPTQEEIVEKDGKRKVKETKKYPGFVFIKMIYSRETAYLITTSSNWIGNFLGPKDKPTPLTQEEILRNGLETRDESTYNFNVGDEIFIIKGVFESQHGKIKSINQEKKKVSISMEMFGRETVFDLNFDDIQKLNTNK